MYFQCFTALNVFLANMAIIFIINSSAGYFHVKIDY